VKRLEARSRVEALLGRVVNGEGRYLPRVREVWIFGSYARGALEVGDVDLAVEFEQTKDEAGRWFATLMAGGFDHLGALRRELRGNQRVLEIHFNELNDLRKEAFEPLLLWRRGDSLEEARARLVTLAQDANARRATRDNRHPLLADVEKLILRPARQEFSLFMWAGWLDATLVELPSRQAANDVTRRRFAEQWSASNPRFRAAHAVASYLEREGRRRRGLAGRSIPMSGRFSMLSAPTGSRASPFTSGRGCPSGRCSISAREYRALLSS
jgi:hypothetical protein